MERAGDGLNLEVDYSTVVWPVHCGVVRMCQWSPEKLLHLSHHSCLPQQPFALHILSNHGVCLRWPFAACQVVGREGAAAAAAVALLAFF